MTNQNINDFIKESYTVFRQYRDHRPVEDPETEIEVYRQFSEITSKYGIFDEDGKALNGWIYDFVFSGLMRELLKKEAND